MPTARVIAFYLPQFHTIPENDRWWGLGFTEWTNVAKAQRLYPGHYQPRRPADFGYYDLRVPETRKAQADLAKQYGIEGFCYYHYWFAGRRLLERPFNEVCASGEPDLPFCLCWANQSWTGIWHGAPGRMLIEQTYPGQDDHRAHFAAILPALTDRRYIQVDGKPLFVVFHPDGIPDVRRFVDLWRGMASEAGLDGLHLVAVTYATTWDAAKRGFDATIPHLIPLVRPWQPWSNPTRKLLTYARNTVRLPTIYRYSRAIQRMLPTTPIGDTTYPCAVPNWDNTPRSGSRGKVLHGSTPALFSRHFREAVSLVQGREPQRQIVFIKSWNEWAEGNYLEPDTKFGRAYLEVIRDVLAR